MKKISKSLLGVVVVIGWVLLSLQKMYPARCLAILLDNIGYFLRLTVTPGLDINNQGTAIIPHIPGHC